MTLLDVEKVYDIGIYDINSASFLGKKLINFRRP